MSSAPREPHARAVAGLALLLLAAVLAGCAGAPQRSPLASWSPSPNHDERRARLIVLHHTEMSSFEAALATLKGANAGGPVSAHYLIGEDGRIAQLVDERARAWHAGAGRWRGLADLNSASIGIELDNDGREPFAEAQIVALLALLGDLTTRLGIDPREVVAHGDVAPTRKRDPHPGFPWARLAAEGYGLWPRAERTTPPPGFDPWTALALIGYDLSDRAAALRAYRRHYRGDEAEALDGEDLAILRDLSQQIIGDDPDRAPAPD